MPGKRPASWRGRVKGEGARRPFFAVQSDDAKVRESYCPQDSRYLRQLPSPCSPNSSLWRQALRNSSQSCRAAPSPLRSVSMRTPPGPISIACENPEVGKAKRAAATMASAYVRIKNPPCAPSHELGRDLNGFNCGLCVIGDGASRCWRGRGAARLRNDIGQILDTSPVLYAN